MDSKNQNKDEDVFHFIGYIPIDGRLYELDGLKSGPVDLGPVGANQNWVDVVRPIIEKRMLKYSEGEIHFNLMAIVSDRQMIYQKKIDELLNSPENAMDTDDKQNEIARLRSLIEDEIAKKKRYKVSCLSKAFNSLFYSTLSLTHLQPTISTSTGREHPPQTQLSSIHCGTAENVGGTRSVDASLRKSETKGRRARSGVRQSKIICTT